MKQPLRVLFVCTGNSCRSQMAEAFLRHYGKKKYEVYSAGTDPEPVHPLAIKVMKEKGLDIGSQHSNNIMEYIGNFFFNYAIIVCDKANSTCPGVIPGVRNRLFWPFEDPASFKGTEEEKIEKYREVRDKIEIKVQEWLKESSQSEYSDQNRNEQVLDTVRDAYSEIAVKDGSCCGPSPQCCGPSPTEEFAKGIGYSEEELSSLPEGANMGLSCGNPTALASLKPGEVVLDLGSGGGFDVFIAARKVGPEGRAVGVDMTSEMVTKARRNAEGFKELTGLSNVEFRLGEIEHLPAADNSVDVVISNCVINLSPQKQRAWSEIARILKPGGRVAVSDLALLKPLPESIRHSVDALVGCVAGAVLIKETEAMVKTSGLEEISLSTQTNYIDSMEEWEDPHYKAIIEQLPAGEKLSDYVTSLSISAHKPIQNSGKN